MEESRTEDPAALSPTDQLPNLIELVELALEGIESPGPCVGDDASQASA